MSQMQPHISMQPFVVDRSLSSSAGTPWHLASPSAVAPVHMASPRAKDDSELRGTVGSAIINLLATAMGGGLLSLPHAFADCGVLVGTLFLAASGTGACMSLELLVACARHSGNHSFEGNASFFLGVWGARVLSANLIILLFFASAAMCVIIMELAPIVLQGFFGQSWALQPALVGFYAVVLMLPLSTQKSLSILRYTSFVALVCIGYFFSCLLVTYFSNPRIEASVQVVASPGKWFEGLPVMFSAYLCQFNIFKIDAELRPADRPKIRRVIRISILGVATMVYIVGGLLGYLMVGAGVSDNLLKEFQHDPKFQIARGMLALTNMCKLPLLLIPLRESILECVGVPTATSERYGVRVGMCVFLSGASLLFACCLQTLSKALGLLGCTSGVLIAFILPGLMRLAQLRQIQRIGVPGGFLAGSFSLDPTVSTKDRAVAWALIVGGILAGVLSLFDMLSNWKTA